MDTQNASLNTRVSAESRGRVLNRQVLLSEQGRMATRMFLGGGGDRTVGELGQLSGANIFQESPGRQP